MNTYFYRKKDIKGNMFKNIILIVETLLVVFIILFVLNQKVIVIVKRRVYFFFMMQFFQNIPNISNHCITLHFLCLF